VKSKTTNEKNEAVRKVMQRNFNPRKHVGTDESVKSARPVDGHSSSAGNSKILFSSRPQTKFIFAQADYPEQSY
jgi:hypothetical protein